MLKIEEIFQIAEDVLEKDRGLEFIFIAQRTLFIRFARSVIHQNAFFDDQFVHIYLRKGKKIASVSTGTLSRDVLLNAVNSLRERIEFVPEVDGLPGTVEPFDVEIGSSEIEEAKPEEDFNFVRELLERGNGRQIHGIFKKGVVSIVYANGKGVRLYTQSPIRYLKVIIEAGKKLVRKDYFNLDIVPEKVLNDLEWRIKIGDEEELEPGKWTVILEPSAVAEILAFMGFVALNGKAVLEKRSFFEYGKKIFDSRITIRDDFMYPDGFPLPFDFEGSPRKQITLIENGICREVVTNRLLGKRLGKESTGHAVDVQMAIPMHLVMEPGEVSIDEMVKTTEKGIYVSNLHYVNVVNPKDLTLTGMTRFGTYLIENGKITKPIKNLRFHQRIVEAFNNVVSISKEREVIGQGESYEFDIPCHTVVPGMKIQGFTFTGSTE